MFIRLQELSPNLQTRQSEEKEREGVGGGQGEAGCESQGE